MYEEVHMDNHDEEIARYLEMGAIEIEGVDEDGEIVYSISDSAEEIAPELWSAHIEYVDNALLDLYQSGLISIEYNEDLEATINLSKEGYNKAKSMGLIEIDIDKNIPND
jgi:hypothetical protein